MSQGTRCDRGQSRHRQSMSCRVCRELEQALRWPRELLLAEHSNAIIVRLNSLFFFFEPFLLDLTFGLGTPAHGRYLHAICVADCHH
jgi:hypothetical protein